MVKLTRDPPSPPPRPPGLRLGPWAPTVELRTRNIFQGGAHFGIIEQLWRRGPAWEWRRIPLVPTDAPMSGVDP